MIESICNPRNGKIKDGFCIKCNSYKTLKSVFGLWLCKNCRRLSIIKPQFHDTKIYIT